VSQVGSKVSNLARFWPDYNIHINLKMSLRLYVSKKSEMSVIMSEISNHKTELPSGWRWANLNTN